MSKSFHSSKNPPRLIPVSTSIWIRAFFDTLLADSDTSRNPLILETPISILWVIAESKSEPGETSQARIGVSTPFSRRVIASSKSATPNQDAPAFTAACETRIRPCPYASAFTTANTSTPHSFFNRAIFVLNALRSIRNSARSLMLFPQ